MRAPSAALLALALAGAASAPARAESPIKDDETVVVFDTAAHRDGKGWRVPLHAWIFEPEGGSVWRSGMLGALRLVLDVDASGARGARFREMARWFLVDNERGKRLELEVAGRAHQLPRSGEDGHARSELRLAGGAAGWTEITTRARDGRVFRGRALLVPRRGISVVSDIDDTIKVTEVLAGHRRILERTLTEPFEPVPGMADVYRRWAAAGAVFHYVSGSPWQLYPELHRFLGAVGFPPGTFELREFRAKDERRLNLLMPPRRHKLASIGGLLRRFPGRTFVLVGDTGESDPELYGELARTFSRQISAIAIRRLPGDDFSRERQRRAFAGVKARVITFDSSSDLPELSELTRR